MKFIPTHLQGAYIIDIEALEDSRGFFARTWCQEEFQQHGIDISPVQMSVSHNALAGTLRGLHFQWPPSLEAKLVRCQRGRVYDVIVDLRPDSATFTGFVAVELDSRKHNALYVPPGFAHGFQTLEANSDITYMMSTAFRPELADGLRYNDPQFEIDWPLPVSCILDRDRDYPNFNKNDYSQRYFQALKATNNASSAHQDKGK
ncbi:MAG: dTDP-4-dehydrorhamnose 3,5-epimerase [Pseudomonadales bacterium]|nr:dTDP-4-dehydrorhamnose 3,5-epimerase [Pseudomonadales bacterium]MCP5216168.1 dTDP-4-dehydrorhamnose 3,5-epimerase [Pseudomonadales bacterium]